MQVGAGDHGPGAASAAAQPPRAAATVVLLRAGVGGVEVFLMRRHGASGFMAGATVFPGGKIDPADADAPATGLAAEACASALGLSDPRQARAFYVAAVRELHEESHVLLARDAAGRLPDAATVAALDGRLEGLRVGHRLAAGDWHRVVAEAGLVPALDALVPFAHWLTPRVEPVRFDTFFFAASCPPGQRGGCDRHESTAAEWCTPAGALADHASGGATLLPPPTQHTLARLRKLTAEQGEHQHAQLAACPRPLATSDPAVCLIEALGRDGVGPCIEPHFLVDAALGPLIALPDDPLHPAFAEAFPQGRAGDPTGHARHNRFVLSDGRFSWQQPDEAQPG